MHARCAAALAAALALAVVLPLSGCTAEKAETTSPISLGLTGPWAPQFEQAFAEAKTDDERDILRDGEVSPAEYEQTKARVQKCVGDSGYTVTWDAHGGLELGSKTEHYPDDFFEESDPVLKRCEARWEGSIRFLFEQIRRNPEKRDEAGIAVACLRAAKLVDSAFTESDWRSSNETDVWPFDATSEAASRCSLDPLGLWYRP